MAITLPQASELVERLQEASRLLAGFYQSILPILDRTAQKCGLDFFHWEALLDNSCDEDTRPSGVSAWSFLPLYSSYHLYGRCKNEDSAAKGDVLAAFMLHTEDTSRVDRWERPNIPPDPVAMAPGRAVLEVFVFRCVAAKQKTTMWELFEQTGDWVREEGWREVGQEALRGYYLHFDLAEFMADQDQVVQALTTLLTEPIDSEA
jgi:hypothetical protein